MWKQGAMLVNNQVIKYWVKHYEEPSEYGIEGGRISKLTLRAGDEEIANYDRGWDIEPKTENAEIALAILMKEYN